jgi:hypothetical protein
MALDALGGSSVNNRVALVPAVRKVKVFNSCSLESHQFRIEIFHACRLAHVAPIQRWDAKRLFYRDARPLCEKPAGRRRIETQE